MILPDKNIKLDHSLLKCGGIILKILKEPLTISALWESVKNQEAFGGFEKFVLTMDFLYMINAIQYKNGVLRRCEK